MDSKVQTQRLFYRKITIFEFIGYETQIKVGSELVGLWVTIEPGYKKIIGRRISKERNMFVAKHLLSGVVEEYGKHPVSTDCGDTWYSQAYRFLKLKHHLHYPFESY